MCGSLFRYVWVSFQIFVGLFQIFVGLFQIFFGLFQIFVGLFQIFVGLFQIFVGLFQIFLGLFSVETVIQAVSFRAVEKTHRVYYSEPVGIEHEVSVRGSLSRYL